MRMAERRNAAAAAPKTTSSPVAASSRPPIAGPPKMPRLSMVLEVTLAAVSSGVLATEEGARPAPGARRSTRWPRALRGRRRGRAALHDDDRRRRREEDGPGELGDDDHTLAAVSIAEQSRERRSDRRRGETARVRRARRRRRRRPGTRTPPARCRTPSAPRSKPPTRPRSAGYSGSGRPGRRSAQSPRDVPAARSRGKHPTTRCVFRMEGGRFLYPPPSSWLDKRRRQVRKESR